MFPQPVGIEQYLTSFIVDKDVLGGQSLVHALGVHSFNQAQELMDEMFGELLGEGPQFEDEVVK